MTAPSVANSSGTSEWSHVTGVSQNVEMRRKMRRVARVLEEPNESMIFDIRDSPKSSAGSIQALQFYIGDDDNLACENGVVRAVVEEWPDEMHTSLLDSGADAWGVDPVEQTLIHRQGVKVPIELQNRSVTVKGWVRVMNEPKEESSVPLSLCAVKADVMADIERGVVGWNLDANGLGIGHHYADHFQDPTLIFPGMSSDHCRTTLLKDRGEWFVLELCERIGDLVFLEANFHEYAGNRDVMTIITDGDKDPMLMGFRLVDAEPLQVALQAPQQDLEGVVEPDELAPEDQEIDGQDIEIRDEDPAQGADIPQQGRIVIEPNAGDKILVNGVELSAESTLAALRVALTFYNLSTSGNKSKCFRRLVNQLELEGVYAAARQQELELHRPANAPRLAELPSEQEQMSHRLTHLPYQPWCESCVAFRARMDRRQRDDSARRSGTPTISFGLAFTKAVPQGEDPQCSRTLMALIMVCSQTGYIGCCPIKQKNSFTMMTRELIAFTSLLGHSEVVYVCDDEPTMRQLLRMVVNTRLKMGLATRTANPPAYSHGNSLCENTVERVRSLAGSLMRNISLKLNVEFSTNNPLSCLLASQPIHSFTTCNSIRACAFQGLSWCSG